MNEDKIKELEAEIEALKKEKPRTEREILLSIEKLVKNLPTKTSDDYTREALPFGSFKRDDGTWLLPDHKAVLNNDYPRYGALSPDLRSIDERVKELQKRYFNN